MQSAASSCQKLIFMYQVKTFLERTYFTENAYG